MFFYLVHEAINALPWTADWTEGRKNCLTLMIGAYMHFFTYMGLDWVKGSSSNKIFEFFLRFYIGFIFIDAFTMAIKYKLFWGRSIVNELDDTADDKWKYDENKHRYVKKKTKEENLDSGEPSSLEPSSPESSSSVTNNTENIMMSGEGIEEDINTHDSEKAGDNESEESNKSEDNESEESEESEDNESEENDE